MESHGGDETIAFRQLSDKQEMVLAILPIPSAILSIFGSFVIIAMAFKSHRKTPWTPYHGLLTGMSMFDILFSITLAAGSFLYPQETSHRVWALGNEATCDAIGFFQQFSGYAAVLYQTMLSFYFLLVTRYTYSDVGIAIKYETSMHVVCLGWPMLTAYAALYLDFYSEREVNMGCWVRRDIPKNCGPDGTGEKCQNLLSNALFGSLLMVICLVTLIANNVRIWKYVRQQAEAHRERLSFARNAYGDANVRSTNRATNDSGETPPQGAILRLAGAQKQHQEKLQRHRTQAFLFVGGFLVCNAITYGLRNIEARAESDVEIKELPYQNFGLLVVQAILYPLQGWLNMFVFLRPSYIRLRTSFPSESKRWCCWHAIFFDAEESKAISDKADELVHAKEGTRKMERRKTAISSGDISTSDIEPKQEDDSRRIKVDGDDQADPNTSLERAASIVMMDGSVHSIRK